MAHYSTFVPFTTTTIYGKGQNMKGINKKVQEVIKQLETNLVLYEEPEYRIVEISAVHGENSYIVHNLEVECENDEVYFCDKDDKIRDNGYALMGFLTKSVRDIIIDDRVIEIFFDSNSISIKLVA